MSYPNMNGDQELFKVKTKDDEIKEIKIKTEKLDNEISLKYRKIDNAYYK